MNPNSDFLRQFISGLVVDATSNPGGNLDTLRFPETATQNLKRRLREALYPLAARFGWSQRRFNPRHVERALALLLPHLDGFNRSYARWADDESRQIMLELLRYRVLSGEHVLLGTHSPEYWQVRARTEQHLTRQRQVTTVGDLSLDLFELPGREGPIHSIQRPIGAATTFVLEQYRLSRGTTEVAASPGDVVLDCGGCWGDTALYFADRVGEKGRVYSFEFDPANLAIFERNLAANPRLAGRIQPIKHPLWSKSGEVLRFNSCGPATTLAPGAEGKAEAVTLTIDDLVEREALTRVDFIKMDIEGAELGALEGARKTLARFAPKLAICAYHKVDDFVTIADFIDSLGLGYRQWLAHFTIHLEESVIFAAR